MTTWEVANEISSDVMIQLLRSGVEIRGTVTMTAPTELAHVVEEAAAEAGIVLVRVGR